MSIQNLALRASKKTEFFVRRNAPTILTGVGVAGFTATVALTIRATAKAIDVLPDIKKQIQDVKESPGELTDKQKSQALAKVYVESGIKLAKIYSPTLVTGSTSIACVLAGHGMMLKRQAQLVAVYAALDASFKAYRRRVAEQIGEEEERKLFRRPGMRALDQIEEGEEPSCVIDMSDVLPSPYARFFDETSPSWNKNSEYNLMFLTAQEQFANDQLRAYGYLFLNDVYKSLGLPRTQAGQIVGWKYDGVGDGFVSFGIHDAYDENKRAFVNGLENVILLDFNVDGVISIP